MIQFLFICFCVVFVPDALARGYVIGNGGDAYEIDGKVFMSDLLEAGVQNSPLDTRTVPSPEILERLKKLDISFSFPREALARKLTELDVRSPGIAQSLLLAMGFFRWRLIEVPIGRVENREGNTLGLPESSRVQAAVRLSDIIRIQSQVWDRLDDLNKIALLLHETIFSLTRVEPYGAHKGIHFQSARKARELVGLAFSLDLKNYFKQLAHEYLYLPSEAMAASFEKIPKWHVEISDGRGGITFLRAFQLAIPSSLDVSALNAFIAETCRQVPAKKTFPSLSYLSLTIYVDTPLQTRRVGSYTSPFGFQYAVSILMLSSEASQKNSYIALDEAACKKSLSSYGEIFKAAGVFLSPSESLRDPRAIRPPEGPGAAAKALGRSILPQL